MSARALLLPRRGRGRPTAAAEAEYQADLQRFAASIVEINLRLDFRVSSRGWCYLLEEHGLAKGDFDIAQRLINDCRKSELLPPDICAEDEGRPAEHLERIDGETAQEFAAGWIDYVRDRAHEQYTPTSFWDDLDVYVEMTVEKVDLKGLFRPVCGEFHVAIANISGWNDINARIAMMRRFARWERRGKQCVLLLSPNRSNDQLVRRPTDCALQVLHVGADGNPRCADRDAILRYVPAGAAVRYEDRLRRVREQAHDEIGRLLAEGGR